MVKLMIMLKRKSGMSSEDFRHYYETKHVPLGDKYIGHLLVDYKRHYPLAMSAFGGNEIGANEKWEGGRFQPKQAVECGYDVISVYTLRDPADVQEMTKILSDPVVQRTLAEDESRFLDRAACRMGMCDVVEGEGRPVALQS